MTPEIFAQVMVELGKALQVNAQQTARLADEFARMRGSKPEGPASEAMTGVAKAASEIRRLVEAFNKSPPRRKP